MEFPPSPSLDLPEFGDDDARDGGDGDDIVEMITPLQPNRSTTLPYLPSGPQVGPSYADNKAIKTFGDSLLGWLVGLGIGPRDAISIVDTYSEGEHPAA